MTTAYSYETCDLTPWLQEISNRMHEAAAANTPIVNLSCTHPRSYIPTQILRRPKVRQLLAGWQYINDRNYPQPTPDNWFGGRKDLETCSTKPFEKEIALREREAEAAAKAKITAFPIVDLTPHHPRGGIPDIILKRIKRRGDRDWRAKMQEEVDRLFGEANKAEAHSKTMKDRAAVIESKHGDPKPLLAASKESLAKAEQLREQARAYKAEMGDPQ